MLEHPWLTRFANVPEDASPPLYMTPVPADATGSYAAEPCECHGLTALEWIERAENKRLRWWQALAITRQLEHDAAGVLCHREIRESAPRRAGKSVRMRGTALWRMAHAKLFGEQQTVVHTGSDIAICREIQRGAWRWSESHGWEVTRANGKEAVETPAGDRWMVRSQDAVYGYDVTLALADECWNVKPDTITEGLEPAMLERLSPQLHLTSTAHRRATSLMRAKIVAALTMADPEPGVLVLIWAAPHGSDPSDPDVWRAASPHWTEDRRRMIAGKHDAALAGQADPQADDPDPMAGFVAQYLNVWPMRPAETVRGDPIIGETAWGQLHVDREGGTIAGAAIESWFTAGVSLAVAWRVEDDARVIVSVTDHDDLPGAVAALDVLEYTGRLRVGASLVDDPALKALRRRVDPGQGRAGALVAELSRLVNVEGVIVHDGRTHLTEQVLAARTVTGSDGPRLVSHGRADAIKAAVWATTVARLPRIGKPRVLLPTGATK